MPMHPLVNLLDGAIQFPSQVGLATGGLDNILNAHLQVITPPLYIKVKRRMLCMSSRDGENLGMSDKETIKRGLAAALKKSGKKKAHLARDIDESPQAVGGWLSTGKISKESLTKFAKACAVTTDYILHGGIEYVAPALPDMALLNSAVSEAVDMLAKEKADFPPEAIALIIMQLYVRLVADERAKFEVQKALAQWTQPQIKKT